MNPEELCSQFRATLLSLSDNNLKRWKKFTGDFPMTKENFFQRIESIKFSNNKSEKLLLWEAFNAEGRELQFREFVSFIQSETSLPKAIKIENSDPSMILANVAASMRNYLDSFLDVDPNASGFVSQRDFAEILISRGAIRSLNEANRIIMSIDTNNSGRVNYFKLLLDASYVQSEPRSSRKLLDPSILKKNESRIPAPGRRQIDSEGRERTNGRKLDPAIFGDRSQEEPQEETRRGRCLDPSIFGEKACHEDTTQFQGARARNLDPSIFGEKRQENREASSHQGGRNLDPSIFGERVHEDVVRKVEQEFDYSETKDGTEYNDDVCISLIAKIANTKFRTIRDCFGSWRTGDRLSVNDIRIGVAKEGNVELSKSAIERIVNEFGGPLTVSSFTRLVSEGARINAPEPAAPLPPQKTETDELIEKLAAGLAGKDWEAVIMSSKNALDLSRNLKKFDVNVKSEEVRGLFSELGMKNICRSIKEKQKPPKKRRV